MQRLPKKKYRDKVRQRLQTVRDLLLGDPARLEDLLRRIGIGKGSDLHNKVEAIKMLLDTDVPALLDSMDGSREQDDGGL